MDTADAFATAAREQWSEDLRLHAVRGVNFGRALCTCSNSYHVTWGVFRAAGYKVALKREEPVLRAVLSRHISPGTRILIGGSADTGVLCVVGRAAGGHAPDITVLDRCAAPLRVIEEFARERKLPVRTLHANLLDLDAEARWELAVLHYTLWYVAPELRLNALERLARALTKGGILVCSVRLGLGKAPENSAAVAQTWLAGVRRLVDQAQLELPLSEAQLDELLRGSRRETQERAATIPTADELKALLPRAGFRLIDERDTTNHLSPRLEGNDAPPAETGCILTAERL